MEYQPRRCSPCNSPSTIRRGREHTGQISQICKTQVHHSRWRTRSPRPIHRGWSAAHRPACAQVGQCCCQSKVSHCGWMGSPRGASYKTMEVLGTPIGVIPSVGYVGCMYGGYGSFSVHRGLGLDHLIGAPIVNPDGVIVTADQSLLKGIRGAGDFLVSLSMSLSKCIP